MSVNVPNPFIVGPPVSGGYFVGREATLGQITNLLSSASGNILLFGKRRVGKTSLCLKLLEIGSGLPKTLVAYMSMEANYDRSPQQFAQAVLLHLISKVASVAFSKKYSDLLLDVGKPSSLPSDYRTLLRLVELVRGADRKSGQSSQSTVGAELVFKSGLQETHSSDVRIGDLASFELLSLLEELVELLTAKGFSRCLLCVDEANKLTLESNERVIRENLSIFSAKGLQFCFVTTPAVLEAVKEAKDLFHHRIEIGPFEGVESVRALIEQYSMLEQRSSARPLRFDSEAIDVIWKLSHGFPYTIQFLCSYSLSKAFGRGNPKVGVADVIDAAAEHATELSYAPPGSP